MRTWLDGARAPGSTAAFSGLAPGEYVIRAAVYNGTRWIADQGADGWVVTVVGNTTVFGGDFGEIS